MLNLDTTTIRSSTTFRRRIIRIDDKRTIINYLQPISTNVSSCGDSSASDTRRYRSGWTDACRSRQRQVPIGVTHLGGRQHQPRGSVHAETSPTIDISRATSTQLQRNRCSPTSLLTSDYKNEAVGSAERTNFQAARSSSEVHSSSNRGQLTLLTPPGEE